MAIERFGFEPTVLRVVTGRSVTRSNLDSMGHNVLGAHGAWGSFAAFGCGRSATFRFDPRPERGAAHMLGG